ncbi:hypothetical protein SEMRO_404_G135890.1 [Seminavis robusta]|uniref:Uncharacterized protein n=1 Tax=Seminavis robusta TaxID=568900 RepID=A0A9N8DWT3_9STRA|nr:hypothetical protein SEMRO_404_G135890.1 [Seminavis robusta]|eukprot:Sro404_g135890.1 n/a (262) ;mRNA; r:24677-25462
MNNDDGAIRRNPIRQARYVIASPLSFEPTTNPSWNSLADPNAFEVAGRGTHMLVGQLEPLIRGMVEATASVAIEATQAQLSLSPRMNITMTRNSLSFLRRSLQENRQALLMRLETQYGVRMYQNPEETTELFDIDTLSFPGERTTSIRSRGSPGTERPQASESEYCAFSFMGTTLRFFSAYLDWMDEKVDEIAHGGFVDTDIYAHACRHLSMHFKKTQQIFTVKTIYPPSVMSLNSFRRMENEDNYDALTRYFYNGSDRLL